MTVANPPAKPVSVPAEYESDCTECGERIKIGEPVARLNFRWVHAVGCWHEI